jgi:uncharacterized protein YbdZ (MbtH family)
MFAAIAAMAVEKDEVLVGRLFRRAQRRRTVFNLASDNALPSGWRSEGFSGSKQDCLDHIDKVWTDMRPASLRHALDVTP